MVLRVDDDWVMQMMMMSVCVRVCLCIRVCVCVHCCVHAFCYPSAHTHTLTSAQEEYGTLHLSATQHTHHTHMTRHTASSSLPSSHPLIPHTNLLPPETW